MARAQVILYGGAAYYDWLFEHASLKGDTRWLSQKTIYDPCPYGYRVPDGGENSVLCKALDSSPTFDSDNYVYHFSYSESSTSWYPAAGLRGNDGYLYGVGSQSFYSSCSPDPDGAYAYAFDLTRNNLINIAQPNFGLPVRCQKEH